MKKLVVTSPGLLLILAIIAASSIFLLDVFYLQPRTLSQQDGAMRERAQTAQMATELTLRAEEDRLATIAASLATHWDEQIDGRLSFTMVKDAARLLSPRERLALTDANGQALSNEIDLGAYATGADLAEPLPETTTRGLIRQKDHVILFARSRLLENGPTP